MHRLPDHAPEAFSAARDRAEWQPAGFVPQDLIKDGVQFRSRSGEYFGSPAYLKVPWEDPLDFVDAETYRLSWAQTQGACREAQWLAALRDSRSPTLLRLTPALYDSVGPGARHKGYFITSYIKGITPSDDQIRSMPVLEQRTIGETLAGVIIEFAKAIPQSEYDCVKAKAPIGVFDARRELEANALYEPNNKRLDMLYDLGYEWLVDALMLAGREYIDRNQAGQLEPTMIGHGNLHGNVMFTYPNRAWQVEAITGLSRVMPSTPECELAFLYAYGEHALASGVAAYERATGEHIDDELLQFWIRAHLPSACARMILEGRPMSLLQREALERWIPDLPWDRLPEAARDADLPLRHVRAVCPPIAPVPAEFAGTARGDTWEALNTSLEASIEHAGKLGAAVVRVADQQTYVAERTVRDSRTVVMYDNLQVVPPEQYAADADEFFGGAGSAIRRPQVAALAQCSEADLRAQLQAGKPFVLAYPAIHRGNCKYLIKEPWQLDRVLQFCADHPAENWPAALEVRKYIETPSEYFTTVRVLGAVANILAVGIVCSKHTKSSGDIVENDRLDQCSGPALQLKRAFELRGPLFLESPDIRSNNSLSGGDVIPLTGPALATPYTDRQREIVRAYGIDPDRSEVPATIRRPSELVLNFFGRRFDILLGLDFMVERQTLESYLGEWNPDPMMGTYLAAGHASDMQQAFIQSRLRAVESLGLVARAVRRNLFSRK